MTGVKAIAVDEFSARYMLVDKTLQDHAGSGQWSVVRDAANAAKEAGVKLEGLPEFTAENIAELQKNHAISADDATRFRQGMQNGGGGLLDAYERLAQQDLARKVAEGQQRLRDEAALNPDERVRGHGMSVRYDGKTQLATGIDRGFANVLGATDGEDIALADRLHLPQGLKSGDIIKRVEDYLVHTNIFEKETAKGFLTKGTTMLADAERVIKGSSDADTKPYAMPIIESLREAADAYQAALKNEMAPAGPGLGAAPAAGR